MDDKQDEIEFLKVKLAELTMGGMQALIMITSGATLLQYDLTGKDKLSAEEKLKIVESIIQASSEYLVLLENNLNERKRYYGQLDDKTDV